MKRSALALNHACVIWHGAFQGGLLSTRSWLCWKAAIPLRNKWVSFISGMILWQTSEIVNGGETNYVLATVSLYVSIYNLFTSLLHLLGAFMGERE